MAKLPFDVVRDFAPISLAAEINNCLVVHPSLPVKTVKELIAFSKARPGQLNYASGVPGFEFESWTGFLAPAGTPPEVIARVNAEVVRITTLPETNERLPGFAWVGSSPQDFGSYIKANIARIGKVVREANIKAE